MILDSHVDGPADHSAGRRVPVLRQILNVLGCLLTLPCYYLTARYSQYPVTLDILITVTLAEINRFVNEGRRMAFYTSRQQTRSPPAEKSPHEKMDLEMQTPPPRLECLAAVVGWREDPVLFTRALESYKTAQTCRFLLVGVDGDEAQDQDMVSVFSQVYPDHSKVIHVPEPLGEVAERVRAKVVAMRQQYGLKVDEAECDRITLQHCLQLARTILDQEGVHPGSSNIRHLCIRQRHMHKKGIMFTTFIFSLVIADALGIEFMWSSDSDTVVFADSLQHTIDTIAADPAAGGASSGLVLHNAHESAVSRLAATVYWGELYLTRSTPAFTATSDCQSGPSSAFRLAALPSILIPWYLQTVMGKRMIVNEDRHLTTNLLLRGWGVIFASDVITATDTPTTMPRWLKQQVRWARATHIESLLQPRVYATCNPLLFYGMLKREFGPLLGAVAVVYYLLTARRMIEVFVGDIALRFVLAAVYNLLRNPDRLVGTSLWWAIPGMLFYHIPLPAVQVWSLMTLTADGWGTSMRASGEKEKARAEAARKAWFEMGFFVVWMMIVAGVAARATAAYFGFAMAHEALLMMVCMAGAFGISWKVTIGNV